MSDMRLYILGCGSATPNRRHLPSSQVLELHGKLFLIDCGEGTQLQFRYTKLNYNKLSDIFISHLHGDHCFGLIGLISTMSLLGRTAPLRIHAHADLEKITQSQIDYFCRDIAYPVEFYSIESKSSTLIYQDRSIEVFSLPLKHRIPTTGFLFREKARQAHILKDMIDFYNIPLRCIPDIKEGKDFVTEDGKIIPNERLTKPAKTPRSYAYCSDTQYNEKLIPLLEGVDTLYHEATFNEAETERAKSTCHSTAGQAAEIAKAAHVKQLIIGHFSARYPDEKILLDEACSIFPQTILSKEGMIVDL